MQRIVIMGAGGRDFHNFNTVYRHDPAVTVVAFTATQIPGIDDRRYPAALAGPHHPDGIPIRPEAELDELIARYQVDQVVFAYSDVAHVDVMHTASRVLAAGADFVLLGPRRTMLPSRRPVVAVCAVRTGCGKSQTARYVGRLLRDAGLRPVLVRHPMPYGDLAAMAVQRFETVADIDAVGPTIEEREEYELPVQSGLVMYAGVDYEVILRQAEAEADVIIWDGGNNDQPFFRPELTITVADALRPGHELLYHPGEANLRAADIVVINKVDAASSADVAAVAAAVRSVNGDAALVRTASPVSLGPGPGLAGKRVLVVEDGPTITHGGMAFGAGYIAAHHHGAATLVDPRPYAVGDVAATFARFPHIGVVLPAMGYGEAQQHDLAMTIRAVPCDVVVAGTPMDLERLLALDKPVRRVTYELADHGQPTLAGALQEPIRRWLGQRLMTE